MLNLLLALSLFQAVPNFNAVSWDYPDTDVAFYSVTNFLVCLDKQATAACTSVPITTGVGTYAYKFPPLLAGSHTVSVQACTLNNAQCSSGISITFNMTISNPINLKLIVK